jgi:uncharacterized protein (DUF1697 family)
MKYVSFLRGINVGGNKKVPMGDLKNAVEALGFSNVTTLLNSGNVVFETDESHPDAVRKKIEKKIESVFGFHADVIIRTGEKIRKLVASDPFQGITVTKQTRLYVTFLGDKPLNNVKVPYESAEKDYKILSVTDGEICSVLTLSEKSRSVDSMSILEKTFGKDITTRNWNTVVKITKH